MTPNATVSYMASQAERQLVEAKAARAWIVDEAARNQTPGRARPPASAAARDAGGSYHRASPDREDGAVPPHAALGMVDPTR